MTTRKKIHAVGMAVLMVLSVLAMAGTAAAAPQAALQASSPGDVQQGDTFEITYEFTNDGDEAGTAGMEFQLPDGVMITNYEPASAQDVEGAYIFGEVAPGETQSVTVTFEVADDASTGDKTVTATGTITGADSSATVDSTVTIESGDDTPTDTPTDGDGYTSDDYDATLTDGNTYWQGQTLFRSAGVDAGETLEVRVLEDDGDVGGLETQVTANDQGEVLVNTADLDGSYALEDSNNNVIASFEVATQRLTTSFAEDSVDNGGDTTEVGMDLDSNRGSYDVEVMGEVDGSSLEDSELADIFSDDGATAEEDDSVVITGLNADDTLNANFSGMDAGEYNFTVSVTDTTAEDDASVTVNDVGAGEANLADNTLEVAQGDIANVTVELSGAASSGTLLVGDETEDGYQANISITDGNDDGEVHVLFNTYTAGDGESWTVVTAADDDDTATLAGETDLSSILEGGDYQTAVSVSNVETTMESPDDLGSLFIAERTTSGADLWTAPSGTDADDLLGEVTQDDTFVQSDWMVVQLSATGLEGVIDAEGSVENAIESDSIGLSVEQTNPGSNRAPKMLNVSNTDFDTISDADNGTYYIAFTPEDADFERNGDDISLAAGDEFNVTVSVQDDRLLGDDSDDAHEHVYHNFEVVAPSVSLDNDSVEVAASSGQSVTGTSTLAPGTEFTVRFRSSDDTEPRFFKTASATVQDDGTWTTTFDFSEQSAGDTFTVSSSGTGAADALSGDGEVVESVSTETDTATEEPDTETATEEPDTETATEEPDTETATEEPDTETETETSTTTPGFGVAVALVALLAAALLAGRRD